MNREGRRNRASQWVSGACRHRRRNAQWGAFFCEVKRLGRLSPYQVAGTGRWFNALVCVALRAGQTEAKEATHDGQMQGLPHYQRRGELIAD
jgi:hypothetical protein